MRAASARGPVRPWEDWEDAILRRMRLREDMTFAKIASVLDRTESSCVNRAQIIGLSTGQPARIAAMRAPVTGPAGVPFDLGPGDDAYVSQCLAQGGFMYRARIGGRIVEVRP